MRDVRYVGLRLRSPIFFCLTFVSLGVGYIKGFSSTTSLTDFEGNVMICLSSSRGVCFCATAPQKLFYRNLTLECLENIYKT